MSLVADYKIIKKISDGSVAEVFLAMLSSDSGFSKLCTVKRLQPKMRDNPRALASFRSEAEICRNLQHSNIIRLIDFEKGDDGDAIIMEFVNGVDGLALFQICQKLRTQISVPMAAYIGAELARGLHYVHTAKDLVTGESMGTIHGDVSPANILISYEGEVKLADFGAAKCKGHAQGRDSNGPLKGNIRYMSPECMHAGVVDVRLDIYSLGVVLWELLSGKELFKGESNEEISRLKLESVKRMQLSPDNDGVDATLEEIIKKCLAYDPIERYKTAQELELELTEYFHARDPGFTPHKLGGFLQSVRAQEYRQMQELIRGAFASSAGAGRSPSRPALPRQAAPMSYNGAAATVLEEPATSIFEKHEPTVKSQPTYRTIRIDDAGDYADWRGHPSLYKKWVIAAIVLGCCIIGYALLSSDQPRWQRLRVLLQNLGDVR